MSNVKTGGMAFPSGEQWRDAAGNLNSKGALHCGMTLRDYFAAQALPAIYKDYCENGIGDNWQTHVAEDAYAVADAMIAQRESNQ